jgi:hypothetical protein
MVNWKNWNLFLTTVLLCLSINLSYAQPAIQSSINKQEILIGEQFTLTIKADFSKNNYIFHWPIVTDSMAHFEVVNSRIDSIYNNQNLSGIVNTITFTSFDSGKWVLPSLLVKVETIKQDSSFTFFTDSLPVIVSFSTSDTTKQIRDIKPIKEAETTSSIGYWIVGILVLLLLTALYIRWRKRKNKDPHTNKLSKLTAYEEAMQELKNLEEYNLSIREEVKIFHSKMGVIFKQYLSRVYLSAYSNKTTDEILLLLKVQQYNHELLSKASASLRCGDAVKFAKYLPPILESAEAKKSIEALIEVIQKNAALNTSTEIKDSKKTN